MLTPITTLRHDKMSCQPSDIRLKNFIRYKPDFDVYLKSYGVNLQRDLVWTKLQKQSLIHSMLIGRDIPRCYIAELYESSHNDFDDVNIIVIDGKQRLNAMIEFCENKFDIELEGDLYYFNDLPESYQLAISCYPVKFNVAFEQHNNRFNDDDLVDWYDRINFAGTPQESDHIENIRKRK